ncbi:MAG: hypothetical protein A2277_21330 [Desulfobacterales bacterium RIFOXYA12_FULL_46_15]|nr:MAG: hypothetical protein A2277_21330 [Desulfobacterales bacterium RIFOXYA12_FULL_46_15]
MLNPVTNVIIQCRFSSTRLPGKAMYPLRGIPLLAFLIRRLKTSLPHDAYRIVVATTENQEDNTVAAWAGYENVHVIRGSLNDVLSRYLLTVATYPADTNVRVTADNPLTCPEIIKASVSLFRKKGLDYVHTESFPYGAGVDVFSNHVLNFLGTITTDPLDREHINNYILKNPEKFHLESIHAKGKLFRPDLNMSVDTQDDFKRVSGIINSQKNQEPWTMTLNQAINNMDSLNKTGNRQHVENTPF